METKPELLQKFFGISKPADVPPKYSPWGGFNPPPGAKLYNMTFPYQAASLPYPIPTPHEIAKARETGDLTNGRPWGKCVIRVNNYAVKFGMAETLFQEAENMLYIENHTTVRSPKLYAAFSDNSLDPLGREHRSRTWYYLVMEFISGKTFYQLSKDTPKERQQEIALKFVDQLKRLRSAVQPSSEFYYGRVDKQSFLPQFPLLCVDENMHGPYTSYDALFSDMYTASQIYSITCCAIPDFIPEQASVIARFKQSLAGRGQRPMLTHTDLKGGNIMVCEGEQGDFELVIIDWEGLCWLPEWVEAANIRQWGSCSDVLLDVLEKIFAPSDLEAARFMWECRIISYSVLS